MGHESENNQYNSDAVLVATLLFGLAGRCDADHLVTGNLTGQKMSTESVGARGTSDVNAHFFLCFGGHIQVFVDGSGSMLVAESNHNGARCQRTPTRRRLCANSPVWNNTVDRSHRPTGGSIFRSTNAPGCVSEESMAIGRHDAYLHLTTSLRVEE